jgi:fructose-1,6-bisphosphatase/inositol monophosphatase family enzyme
VVVVDPVDGSTNAARGLPWFATSLCALDAEGPWVAVVVNQATGATFEAVRGEGARCAGRELQTSGRTDPSQSLVVLNGYPPRLLGVKQYRILGAAALDLCGVASGALDAFVDCTTGTLAPWDYLGGLLVCQEAGAAVAEATGQELVTHVHDARRVPVAAATPELLSELLAVRATFP